MLRAACVALGFAPAIAGIHALPAQVVAHVLDVSGQWRLEGSAAPIASGQGLSAGAKITAVTSHPGDSITIVHDEDMSRQWTACDASAKNPCRNPIVVPGASASPRQDAFMGMVQAAISVLLSKPPAIGTHYALTLTRGDQKVKEMEAVVALDPAQRIVLPPAPDDMAAGQYTFSMARAGEKAATTQTVQLASDGTWAALKCDAPGLYDVSVSNADGEQVADVMLLVTTGPQYQTQQDAFASMKAHTAQWTGPSARSDEHLFLRAFLLQASQPGNRQP